jgi:hypothetical protein
MSATMIYLEKNENGLIDYLERWNKTEQVLKISDDLDDLKQLLWMATNNDRNAFIDQLSWMSIEHYKKNLPIQFVFPNSLSRTDRHNIHKMQSGSRVLYYRTYTDLNGNLNLFINKY